MDIKETDILGPNTSKHWYYHSKARAMINLLGSVKGKSILDIGAGSGFFSKHLISEHGAEEVICVDTNYNNDFDAMCKDKKISFRKSIDSARADIVLLMDVLEHVDDDVALLKDYMAKVPKGAVFLISVPAFNFLWSGHDIFLDHKRRYTLGEIEEVVRCAGLSVIKGAYYFGAIFPIAAAIRILGNFCSANKQAPQSQLKKHNPVVNSLLAALSVAEIRIMKHNRLAGLTAFCLAQISRPNGMAR